MHTETTVASGYTMEIFVDHFPSNPRTEWDNAGTMVCFHRKYRLGDKHDYNSKDFDSWAGLKKQIIKDHDPAAILPIYMYDHSGVTISTTPFDCPWDSGLVGYIYISKEKARDEFEFKRLTAKVKQQIAEYLVSEVKTYDQYLRGDVYGFQILEGDEVIESVAGFYGKESAITDANSCLKYYNEKHPISI
jgi:uncharacterized protein (DUF2249 family)